ncbi:MAG: AI-2E family transporter [Gemmiger sp.]
MNQKSWLRKPPQTTGDWLCLAALIILLYQCLARLNLVWAALERIWAVLSPFAWALALAYLLDPLVRWFCRRVLHNRPGHRWLAILAAYLVLALAVVLLVALVAPQVVKSITLLLDGLPLYVANLQAFLLRVQQRVGVDTSRLVEALGSYDQLLTRLTAAAQDMAPQLLAYAQQMIGNMAALFTALAGSVYLLAEKYALLRRLRRALCALLPPRAVRALYRVARLANQNLTGFFSGKIVDSTLVGVTLFVMMTLLGMEFAPLISVVVGVTDIIPVFGPFLGAVPGVLILLLAEPVQAVEFVVLILIIQQVDGNIIAPRILGESTGLSALWVLFAIVVGGDLFGLAGMVLGVPVFATLYTLAGELVRRKLAQRRGKRE